MLNCAGRIQIREKVASGFGRIYFYEGLDRLSEVRRRDANSKPWRAAEMFSDGGSEAALRSILLVWQSCAD